MKMNSKFKYMYDAAPAVALLERGSVKTADFNGDPITFDTIEGYWNTVDELADQTIAVVINVESVAASEAGNTTQTATVTINGVVATDEITLSDGTDSITLVADTDFSVGADDDATATNLATAINDAHTANDIDATATAADAVVTIVVNAPSGAAFSNPSASFETTAFAPTGVVGNDETYAFSVEVGPTNFASSEVVGRVPVVAEPGQYVVLLDIATVQKSKPNAAAIRIVGAIDGTTPSITAYSWIAGIMK